MKRNAVVFEWSMQLRPVRNPFTTRAAALIGTMLLSELTVQEGLDARLPRKI